jgi:hypothetical protein
MAPGNNLPNIVKIFLLIIVSGSPSRLPVYSLGAIFFIFPLFSSFDIFFDIVEFEEPKIISCKCMVNFFPLNSHF